MPKLIYCMSNSLTPVIRSTILYTSYKTGANKMAYNKFRMFDDEYIKEIEEIEIEAISDREIRRLARLDNEYSLIDELDSIRF